MPCPTRRWLWVFGLCALVVAPTGGLLSLPVRDRLSPTRLQAEPTTGEDDPVDAARQAAMESDYEWFVENILGGDASKAAPPPPLPSPPTTPQPSLPPPPPPPLTTTPTRVAADRGLQDAPAATLDEYALLGPALSALGYDSQDQALLVDDVAEMIVDSQLRRPRGQLPRDWCKQSPVAPEASRRGGRRPVPDRMSNAERAWARDTGGPSRPRVRPQPPPPLAERSRRAPSAARRPRQDVEDDWALDWDEEEEEDWSLLSDRELFDDEPTAGPRRAWWEAEEDEEEWPDMESFKRQLRKESEMRLDLFGRDMLGPLRMENKMRIAAYQWWLDAIQDGIGEDLDFKELDDGPPPYARAPPPPRIRQPPRARPGPPPGPPQPRARPRRREVWQEDDRRSMSPPPPPPSARRPRQPPPPRRPAVASEFERAVGRSANAEAQAQAAWEAAEAEAAGNPE